MQGCRSPYLLTYRIKWEQHVKCWVHQQTNITVNNRLNKNLLLYCIFQVALLKPKAGKKNSKNHRTKPTQGSLSAINYTGSTQIFFSLLPTIFEFNTESILSEQWISCWRHSPTARMGSYCLMFLVVRGGHMRMANGGRGSPDRSPVSRNLRCTSCRNEFLNSSPVLAPCPAWKWKLLLVEDFNWRCYRRFSDRNLYKKKLVNNA